MFDVIIIGAGPAGLTAAIYSKIYGLNAAVVGKLVGGMATEAHLVSNFPGFGTIKGLELMEKIEGHAKSQGINIIAEGITKISKTKGGFECETSSGKTFSSKSVIFATGTEKRKLGLPEEKKFVGKGVSYCAVCDSPFFAGKTVAVAGGANSAAYAALLLAEHAKEVYIIYRRDKLRCAPYVFDHINNNKKIKVIYNANISGLSGDKFLSAIKLDTGRELKVDGLFVEIGSLPESGLAKKLGVKTDEQNYIVVDGAGKTNVEGVFAAGDVTTNTLKQIITACAEGAVAVTGAYEYLKRHSMQK